MMYRLQRRCLLLLFALQYQDELWRWPRGRDDDSGVQAPQDLTAFDHPTNYGKEFLSSGICDSSDDMSGAAGSAGADADESEGESERRLICQYVWMSRSHGASRLRDDMWEAMRAGEKRNAAAKKRRRQQRAAGAGGAATATAKAGGHSTSPPAASTGGGADADGGDGGGGGGGGGGGEEDDGFEVGPRADCPVLPRLALILQQLLDGTLSEEHYPYVSRAAAEPANVRASGGGRIWGARRRKVVAKEVVIFIANGGVTYEEARLVHEFNAMQQQQQQQQQQLEEWGQEQRAAPVRVTLGGEYTTNAAQYLSTIDGREGPQ